MDDRNYMRLGAVVYAKIGDGETPQDVEARFINALPDGMDIVALNTSYWEEDCAEPEE